MKICNSGDFILDEVNSILDHIKETKEERKQRIHNQWESKKYKNKRQVRSTSKANMTVTEEKLIKNEGFDINRYPGKKTLDSKNWDKLKSTPYGYFFDKEGNYHPKILSEMKKEELKCHMAFDHYFFIKDNKAMLEEFEKGKRTFYDLIKTKEKIKNILNDENEEYIRFKKILKVPKKKEKINGHGIKKILNPMNLCDKEDKVYDKWLNAKGKKTFTKLEIKLNRRNLLMALQEMNNNKTQIGETGDLWLDAKGKRTFDQNKSILFM